MGIYKRSSDVPEKKPEHFFIYIMTHKVKNVKTNAVVHYVEKDRLYHDILRINQGSLVNKNINPGTPFWALEMIMGPVGRTKAKWLIKAIPKSKRGIKSKRISAYTLCDKEDIPLFDKRILPLNTKEYIRKHFKSDNIKTVPKSGQKVSDLSGKNRNIVSYRVFNNK